jgi:hypothetical protein
MQLSTVLRSTIVLGLLGSASAQAAMTLPATTTGSSVFVTVFDTSNQESFTTDLGLLYNYFINNSTTGSSTIRDSALAPLSFNLDMSIFANNNPANLLFNVYAGDALGGNTSKGHIMTSTGTPAPRNGQMNGVNTLGLAHITVFNTNCAAATGCAGTFGNESLWGSTINGQFPSGSGAAFDTPIAFYQIAGSAVDANALALVTQFGGADGGWNWLLTPEGTLTFSSTPAPIPLPAAVWLLLSGLAGIGAIGRRSNQKA